MAPGLCRILYSGFLPPPVRTKLLSIGKPPFFFFFFGGLMLEAAEPDNESVV